MWFKPPTRQSSPFFWKRAKYFLSRLIGTRLQKDKNIHFVTVNGQRYKRLILCDSYLASEIEQSLDCFASSGFFPPLLTRYEREIWLEFIEGQSIRSVNEPLVLQIADFYATIYRMNPVLVKTTEWSHHGRLLNDLRFLYQIGVFTQASYQDLHSTAVALTPDQVWIGYDYTDPVLKNFILRPEDGRLCVIDVDGLACQQLIGTGVAKACVRWLGSYRAAFFSSLANQQVPNFQQYFDFIELCFLAKWTKRAFFERDWKVINPVLFERFRGLQ